ncbi:MAG: lipocalin family protein [Oscillospiraceae bacterium]|nr:lipocalin family protein [Oscillospiraceae bacterium]
MKKLLIAIMASLALASSVALAGCGGGAPASIDGTWEITEMTQDGQDMLELVKSLGGLAGVSGADDGAVVEFKDGKATMSMMGETSDMGAYSYENGKLTMGNDTVQVDGDTISIEANGAKMVLKKK